MKTVGLFKEDSRIYYVDHDFVIIDNPFNGGKPVIVLRHVGIPDDKKVKSILKEVNMELVGEAYLRDDGLWCHEVKEKEVSHANKC